MDISIVLFIINGLMGVIMFFQNQAIINNKEKFKDLQEQHDVLRDRAMLKDDFRDFKKELWERLDQLIRTRSTHP
jgi:L-rhamnose isomerase